MALKLILVLQILHYKLNGKMFKIFKHDVNSSWIVMIDKSNLSKH